MKQMNNCKVKPRRHFLLDKKKTKTTKNYILPFNLYCGEHGDLTCEYKKQDTYFDLGRLLRFMEIYSFGIPLDNQRAAASISPGISLARF